MNRKIYLIVALAFMALAWPSCKQVEESGSLKFGLKLSEDSELKSAIADRRVTAALVSVRGENGEIIFDKEYLPLYMFGNTYTTESLQIPVGRFRLTEFMLIDETGMVLWATPVEGSELAHLVRHPLPIPFAISMDETTNLDVQVIRVKDHSPDDFGYVNFNIGFVDRFCLKIFYASRCMDEWNDSILTPDPAGITEQDGTKDPDGTTDPSGAMGAPIYQPLISIWAGEQGDLLLEKPLDQGLNHYMIPLVARWYTLAVTDCHGEMIYLETLPAEELLAHRCSDMYEPLMIMRDPVPPIVITPEGLYEPTIRQGVFGRISYPVDNTPVPLDGTTFSLESVTASPGDGYFPLVRDVYFFPAYILDSIRTFAPIDCYFPPELLPEKPVAIVRSNSDGYFQLPMETGDYLYLVKEDDRYYIDSGSGSDNQGYVKVYPEEVTKLLIQIVDCTIWE